MFICMCFYVYVCVCMYIYVYVRVYICALAASHSLSLSGEWSQIMGSRRIVANSFSNWKPQHVSEVLSFVVVKYGFPTLGNMFFGYFVQSRLDRPQYLFNFVTNSFSNWKSQHVSEILSFRIIKYGFWTSRNVPLLYFVPQESHILFSFLWTILDLAKSWNFIWNYPVSVHVLFID